MLTPSIREDLQLFDGTPLEDGSPSWLLFDTLTNKYFTIGLNAFRLLNYWKADVDTKTFLQNVEQKGVSLKEEELNDFISLPSNFSSAPIGNCIGTALLPNLSRIWSTTRKKLAPARSILFTKAMRGTEYLFACRQTVSD